VVAWPRPGGLKLVVLELAATMVARSRTCNIGAVD